MLSEENILPKLTEKLESKTNMGHSVHANLKSQENNNILAMFL